MKYKNFIPLLLFFTIILSACYPGGAEYYDQLDLVYTNYSKEANFKSLKTYARPDSIVKMSSANILDGDGNGLPDFVNKTTTNIILAQLDANMKAYGYTKVGKNDNPDITIFTVAGQNTDVYYYYNSWYWGWYGSYGGWYYPGYYPPTYSSVTTGGLLFQMTVPKDSSLDGTVPVVWLSVMSGLLESASSGASSSRIKKSIDQAFIQSPYLKQ